MSVSQWHSNFLQILLQHLVPRWACLGHTEEIRNVPVSRTQNLPEGKSLNKSYF